MTRICNAIHWQIEKSDWEHCFMWRVQSLSIGYRFMSHVMSMLIDDFSQRYTFLYSYDSIMADRPTIVMDRRYNHTRYACFGLRLMKSAWMLVSFGHRHSFNGFDGHLDIHFARLWGNRASRGNMSCWKWLVRIKTSCILAGDFVN